MRVIAAFALIPMLLGLAAAPAPAQTPGAFDPREHRERLHGEPTRVLVIGTPHLSGTPDDFDPAVLEPLLERLAAFGPDIIAIENLSGESVHALKTYLSGDLSLESVKIVTYIAIIHFTFVLSAIGISFAERLTREKAHGEH